MFKVHTWSSTPYANLNTMVRANVKAPAIAEADRAAPLLKAKPPGDRVLLMLDCPPLSAFDLSDPVKFYASGPFVDAAWSRDFFGRLEQLGASVDLIVFDREADIGLFGLENKFGNPAIVGIVQNLFADAAVFGRLPPSVTAFAPADFELRSPNRVASYTAFNTWAHELYLDAFRRAFLQPARDALGAHILSSEYDTGMFGDFRQPGGEWPWISGTVGGVSSPVTYLVGKTMPTLEQRRDYQLDRLKACIKASRAAKVKVVPWLAPVSYDDVAKAYSIDPMWGVDYVRRIRDTGMTEVLYWNAEAPNYRTREVAARDDAMMAVLASEK